MKRYWIAALAVALLPACMSRAGAITFMPVISGPDVDKAAGLKLAPGALPEVKPSRLRMGILANVWEMPDVNVSAITGVRGDVIKFEPQVMPMVELDYRLAPNWGIGGMYNPLNVDYRFKGPTSSLLTGGAAPRLGSNVLATGTMNMWNFHVTNYMPRNLALQIGVLSYRGSVTALVPNPYQNGYLDLRAAQGATEVQIWGYKSYRIWGYSGHPAFFTGGLGVSRRISKEDGNVGPDTAAQASMAFSYFPRSNYSLDVSSWFADFSHPDSFSVRLTAGVTGHF